MAARGDAAGGTGRPRRVVGPGAHPRQPAALRAELPDRAPRRVRPGGPGLGRPGELAGADRRPRRVLGPAAARSPPCWSRTCTRITTACPARCARQSGAWIGMHEREDAMLAGFGLPGRPGGDRPAYLRWCGAPEEHMGRMTAEGQRGAAAAMARSAMARADRLLAARRPGRRARAPAARRLDARALARAPVLPRRDARAAAHRRPRAAAHHAQRLRLRPGVPTRSPPTWTRLSDCARQRRGRCCPPTSTGSPAWTSGSTPSGTTTLSGSRRRRPSSGSGTARHTAWSVARQVTWSRPWGQLSAFQHQAALGEVVAHLRHLSSLRAVTCAAVSGSRALAAGGRAHLNAD